MRFDRKGARLGRPLLLGAFVGLALAGCGGDNADRNRVLTDRGEVLGNETASMHQYLGIPYAAPPTGARRWKAPEPPAAWSGTREAGKFGSGCPQTGGAFGAASTNEDCLYLNVFTPKGDGPFPVMVWIHGGAFVSGSGDSYDASKLVAQGVAVVTINYRLGHLGFLAHPSLSAEQGGSSGNYGLMDQQAALRWVKNNIAQFRGDPNNVTVFGESAGGLSVQSQVASPLAAGLFNKAIVQSGSYTLDQPSLAQAQAGGTAVATAAGCTDQSASCLRALTVEQILQRQAGANVVPTIDNKVLPVSLRAAFTSGSFNKVPVIEGSNADEYSLLSAARMDLVPSVGPVTAANYQARVSSLIAASGRTFEQVNAQYPLSAYASPVEAYDAIATDLLFACSGRTSARLKSASGANVYAYEFNDPNAPMIYLPPATRPRWGAYHAAEIQYLFPTSRAGVTYTAAQQALSNQMVAYWTAFAKNGNPNGTGPAWPQFTNANDTFVSLEPGTSRTVTNFAQRHKCAFWTGS
ncbi:carboxylesterase/lipase family protein [Noviherbaspirillum sp. CPCC 100848]|uniref:Carboxylic ester hydrolase n=1 Tax=Noviherbaspirillum album TaxID=3080276 RepID=A0ABU6JFN2_9BURK|nr:carboxylesterase/lipase family protein [Noviherbaspirillum sp. CPCC 100848]MEC4722340.1 carboxylesterase/lipase family protein [Noviherbaspirillum sp. CPCC 100848]